MSNAARRSEPSPAVTAYFANQLAEQVRFANLTSPTHAIETAAAQLRPIEQLADWDSSELPAWPRARRTG